MSFELLDGRTDVVKYEVTDRIPNTPPIAFGWKTNWAQMARFLELTEDTAICRLKDDELEYKRTYFKSDIYSINVVNGYDKDRNERVMGKLCRPKTDGEPGKFTFYPSKGMSAELCEAFYPDTAQRLRIKLESELMSISEDGVKRWFFIGHQTKNLYCVDDLIYLWRNGCDIAQTRIQDRLVRSDLRCTRFLGLDALEGTDYPAEGIRDTDGLIHAGLIKRNYDALDMIKNALTKEEMRLLMLSTEK